MVKTLLNKTGTPIPNVTLNFTIIDANTNSTNTITNSQNMATYTYTNNNSTVDSVQAAASNPTVQSATSTVS